MDEFIMICTKLAKEMDAGGMDAILDAANSAKEIMKKSEPLLKQVTVLADEIGPMLEEMNRRDMVGTMQDLTSAAATAIEDINKMSSAVITEENLSLLRESVGTLVNTLKNIEVRCKDFPPSLCYVWMDWFRPWITLHYRRRVLYNK